jgi:uncharacterized DUF497 family protein
MIQIYAFLFDEENEEKLAAHGIRQEQVAQILDDDYRVESNRKGRRAVFLVIGRDWGGACIAVPVEPTHDPYLWRPIAAWPCKASEEARLDH